MSQIYSDGIHLIHTGGLKALHAYAASIGIKRCWYHSGSKWPHYDIPKGKRATFFQEHPEVKQVTSREIIRLIKSKTSDG